MAERLAVPAKALVSEIRSLRYLDRKPISVDVSYVPSEIGHAEVRIGAASADKIQGKLLRIEPGAPLRFSQSAGATLFSTG